MYSPKIDECLVPCLYHAAKAKHLRMTTFVNQLLRKALRTEELPAEAREALYAAGCDIVLEVKAAA